MPKLDWIGKQYVVNHVEQVPFRLLKGVPESSYNQNSGDPGNMIVHGDNLEGLKALLPYYRNQVKLVFIDPPYNTGNEDWVYNDRMNAPKMKQWLGKVVGGEGEDLSRHDKWLCMMYPRLQLLRELLSEDGSIWVTMDDNEAHYAKVLMDEIFGRDNFIASVIWQKVFSPKNTAKYFSDDHDYVLVYAKNAEVWRPNLIPRSEAADERYKNPDNDPRGPWTSGDLSARNHYSKGTYPVTTPSGKVISGPPKGSYWRVSKEYLEELNAEGRIWWGKDQNNVPRLKRFLSEVKQGVVPQTIWSYEQAGHTQDAKKELVRLMDFQDTSDVFITPKPVKLLQRIIQVATDQDSIVLDSFAGSGTTAHAVLKQNAEDGGSRRFALVEMEDYADSLTAERVRRAIRGEGGQPYLGSEAGFDFYGLGEELVNESGDDINPEIKREELARFVLFLETGRAAESIAEDGSGYIGAANGAEMYLFYVPDQTATFGEDELAALPCGGTQKMVYADRCTVDDDDLAARSISFRKLPRDLLERISRWSKEANI
ncbi:site-specific DNA-methyltransferase [Rubrobacter aplysinae]|uniref:site-specific DNA-methyltransferase n=1 Tax=Rubrobacter aplysinae TaxID=909625 RepID=UPI00064B9D7E|nr:site-specific DNA-methyltransferase [Rubrobacter aplysinae]